MQNQIKESNILLLDDAYKNVSMGHYAIDCIEKKIKNNDFRMLVEKQNNFYLDYTKKLNTLASELDYIPKELNAMLKTSSYLSINFKTLMNKETSHIAQMLIEGTTMGITTLIKEVNDNLIADQRLIQLSKDIIAHQEKFVESLKDFL